MMEVMVVGALSSVILHVYVKINNNIYYWVLHKIKTLYKIKHTVAQKTASMFAYYIKTHVLLNADII